MPTMMTAYPMDEYARKIAKRFLKDVDDRIFTLTPEDLLTKFYMEVYKDAFGEELKNFFWSDREIRNRVFNGMKDKLANVVEEMAGSLDEVHNTLGAIVDMAEKGSEINLSRDSHSFTAIKHLCIRVREVIRFARASGLTWKKQSQINTSACDGGAADA